MDAKVGVPSYARHRYSECVWVTTGVRLAKSAECKKSDTYVHKKCETLGVREEMHTSEACLIDGNALK